ncbi:hypothetical protein RJ639_009427 [Escallonia herrerae]|uniref:Uncharacterized protein n=1 Tax=Escallonia herrerae TaxID=1293975 RepID=A0AA88VTK3_9ASTE|nr:hypothetical protein RJ639_009427 [Escallonia herrerae]
MDLGCLDMGCVEKQRNETFLDSQNNTKDSAMSSSGSAMSSSKVLKNKTAKEASQSSTNLLSKFTSQIKKPPHRKTSPLNWFPRKKVDSYLKRKIKLLQEVGGMSSTLDETLGDSNPHYSRVLREKIAVREAAHKALEARKAALVEASWCRILRAARIECKEAEGLLLKAEKSAAEAFEAATAIGVIMYDTTDGPRKHHVIESSAVDGEESTTHTVTASFETAFEVDKQVAAAVKAAFIRLASLPSMNKDEFKELLRKISQNPQTNESNQEMSEFSSEYESDTLSEFEAGSHIEYFSSQELDEGEVAKSRQKNLTKKHLSEKCDTTKLVDVMLKRLRCLQEDELASLATIVATCGLNAALAEDVNSKQHASGSIADFNLALAVNVPRRMSTFGSGTTRNTTTNGQVRKNQVMPEVPSLDKFLVKRLTRLEREVQEAKNARRNEEKPLKSDDEKYCSVDNMKSAGSSDLGSFLVKHSLKSQKEIEEAKEHSRELPEKDHKNADKDTELTVVVPELASTLTKHFSKLEKEIEEAKRNPRRSYELIGKKTGTMKDDLAEVPSLDKFLVKRVSKLEREVQEAKDKRKSEQSERGKVTDIKEATSNSQVTKPEECSLCSQKDHLEKENIDLNKNGNREADVKQNGYSDKTIIPEAASEETGNSLDKIMVKKVHRLEREKMQASSLGIDYGIQRPKEKHGGSGDRDSESLDKILVKHVSRLEKEKMERGTKEDVMKMKSRDPNTQPENSEGSLDQVLVKHKSRLEREKMAAAQQPDDQIKHSVSRRQVRERELQEAWGGLSLGNSIRPPQSRLQRDKASF